jgi:hypothetical protein
MSTHLSARSSPARASDEDATKVKISSICVFMISVSFFRASGAAPRRRRVRRRLLLADSFHQVVAPNADRLVISAVAVSVGTDRAVVVVAGCAVEDSRRSIHARVLSGFADFTGARAAEHAPRFLLFVQFG